MHNQMTEYRMKQALALKEDTRRGLHTPKTPHRSWAQAKEGVPARIVTNKVQLRTVWLEQAKLLIEQVCHNFEY